MPDTINIGQAVLTLDEVMTHPLWPRLTAVLRETLVPGWVQDQHRAAVTEMRDRLDTRMAAGQLQQPPLVIQDHPGWLRLGVLDTLIRWLASQSSVCLHNPNPARVQPIMGAAWRPGLVTCGSCTHLFCLPHGSPQERTCDGCGHVTDSPTGICPGLVHFGAFTYLFGVCTDCRYWAT
ncbi:MAG: hypothetical protein ACRDRO_21695 [Pseudonocardiaceae bacterium]